jgi:tetratricopeptide (TPR) repeat protein
MKMGNKSKALSHYEEYIKHKPKDVPVLKMLLKFYRADKDRKKEREVLALLVKFQPRKIEHWQARGDLEYGLGNIDSALANYLAIKNIRPRYTKNDVKIGKIYHNGKQYTLAVRYLAKSAGDNEEALRILANAYLVLKQGPKAIAVYMHLQKKVRPKDRDLAHLIYNLCEDYLVNNQLLADAYRNYLRLSPGDQTVQLKKALTELIRLQPGNPEHLQARGDLYYAGNDSLCALRDYSSILRIKPKYKKNDFRIGRISYSLKDYNKAAKYLSRSAAGNEAALKLLAECYLNTKKGRKAANTYKALSTLKPGNKDYAERAVSLSEQYKVPKADLIAAYQALLKADPRNRKAKARLSELEGKKKK